MSDFLQAFLRALVGPPAGARAGDRRAPHVYYRPAGAVPGADKSPPTGSLSGQEMPDRWRRVPPARPGDRQAPAVPDSLASHIYFPPGLRPGAARDKSLENVPEYIEAPQPARMPRYRVVDPYQVVVGLHATFHAQPAQQPAQRMPTKELAPGPDGRTPNSGTNRSVSMPLGITSPWHPASFAAPKIKAPTPPQN